MAKFRRILRSIFTITIRVKVAASPFTAPPFTYAKG